MTKSLAIVGILAAVIFFVWLAVQIVGLVPSAFSSLASLANNVYNYDGTPALTTTTSNTVINSGDSFTISWNEVRPAGTFFFSYACADGISLSLRTTESDIITLSCDESYDLGDVTNVEVMLATERQRFTDVDYEVTFVANSESISDVVATNTITIVNANIPTGSPLVDTIPEMPVVVVPEVPTVETPVAPVITAPPAPTYIEEVIYAIPVSNPNGFTDLKITYLGVGVEKNGVFTRAGTIATNEKGAIRFSVKNVGTRTSEAWSMKADLPSNISYQSPNQISLKPNEEAILTLGFDGITQTGIETFSVTLDTSRDTVTANNTFTWAITIVK